MDVPFVLPLPAEGAVRAEVTDSDGYAADNVRFAVLDALPRPRIVAIASPGTSGGDSFYVERALAAAEGPNGMRLDRVTTESVSADPATLDNAVGIVLFSAVGPRASRERCHRPGCAGRRRSAGGSWPGARPHPYVADTASGDRRTRDRASSRATTR